MRDADRGREVGRTNHRPHPDRVAAVGVALTTLLLVEKSRLHSLVARIDSIGLRSGVRFGVMALVIVLVRRRGRAAFDNLGALLRPLMMRINGMPPAPESGPAPSVGGMPYAVAITLGTLLVLWFRHT